MITPKNNQSLAPLKPPSDRRKLNSLLLLFLWIILGMTLRFSNLVLKPASSIEIATIGYSLGHGFNQIPLNQIVSLQTLLAPLSLDTSIGYIEVLNRLREESTHPPLYFCLTHWWFNLWLQEGELVTLEIARSLSAIFGTLAIPSSFMLAWVPFRSRLVAHFAAVLMALSPYGIYLAQEARHYTLTVLWVMASVICLTKTIKLIEQKTTVPIWLGLVWIVINALGIATHYFFVLALGAEAIALLVFWWFNRPDKPLRYFRSLAFAGIGTLAAAVVWLPLIQGISDNQMTTWIATSYELNEILLPISRLLAWIITMLMLLPVEGTPTIVTIISALIVLTVLMTIMPTLVGQWSRIFATIQTRSMMTMFSGYLLGSLILFLLLIYVMEKDISLAARYHFVYFPLVILLVAIALAACWHQGLEFVSNHSIWLRVLIKAQMRVVIVVLLLGIMGSLTVINDFGFQKSRHSDRLAAHIQKNSALPTIIAMTHETHSEIRELTALAVSFERLDPEPSQLPRFILVNQQPTAAEFIASDFAKTLKPVQQPFILFGVNLDISDSNLKQLGCERDKAVDLADGGYRDRFYVCSN
ncbi:MAG: glycosyltransferase [Cyanobacteria bacterium P01_G01_bin.67]